MVEDYNGPRESGIALSVHVCVLLWPLTMCTCFCYVLYVFVVVMCMLTNAVHLFVIYMCVQCSMHMLPDDV